MTVIDPGDVARSSIDLAVKWETARNGVAGEKKGKPTKVHEL